MRACLTLSAGLFASVLLAAPAPPPGPTGEPPGPRPLRAEARVFALQLLRTADQVAANYVRPVSHEDLLEAALTGLYEAARQPPPRTLTAEMRKALLARPEAASAEKQRTAIETADEVPAEDQAVVNLIQHVRENIGDPAALRDQNSLLICCQAMVRGLDPYTCVVSGKELRRNLAVEEDAEGFGLELRENTAVRPVVVKSVQPGGPAQCAGLRPGDEIAQIDGKPVEEYSRAEMLKRLLQPPDPADGAAPPPDVPPPGAVAAPPAPAVQPTTLTLRRANAAPASLLLECRRFHPESVIGVARLDDNSWTYWVDKRAGLAHVRLAALGKGSAAELRRVVAALHDDGLRGLVLDLRWCPGGFLDEAVDAARLFLDDGVTAVIRSRGKEDVVYRSDGLGALTDFPIVVLVNGETAGGAELIAAALQDRGRAVVAGQRTLGKGSVQTQIPLGVPGAALKLTGGAFFRPNGKSIQRDAGAGPGGEWGVRPDDALEFRISPDLARELKDAWERQTLRPGASAERLPMDDPDADPQRQAALETLRGLAGKKG